MALSLHLFSPLLTVQFYGSTILLPDSYEAIEVSPVCPLGANAAIATVDQNKVGSPDKLVNRYGEGYGLLRGMIRSTSARNKWVCSSVGNV